MKKGPPNSGFFFSAAGQMFFRYYLRENSWGVFTYTAANVRDVTEASKPLREDDEVVYGDSAYLGLEKREEIKNSPQLSAIEYRINRRPGRLPKVSDNAIDWERYIEHQNHLCISKWNNLPNHEKHLRFPKDRLQRVEKESEPIACTFRQRKSVICLPERATLYSTLRVFAPFGLDEV